MNKKNVKILIIGISLLMVMVVGITTKYITEPIHINGPTHIGSDGWYTIATDVKWMSKTIQVTNSQGNSGDLETRIVDSLGAVITPVEEIKVGETKIIFDQFSLFRRPYFVEARAKEMSAEYDVIVDMYLIYPFTE